MIDMQETFFYKYFIDKIDFGTLAILFCLMGVVAGFDKLGYFDRIASKLVHRANNVRLLMLSVIMSAFFLSMLVTNDVGLIIIVPFTIQVLHTVGRDDKLIKVVVLETIAANLGSMLTPVGNPQNVYLYQYYHMNIWAFFRQVMPYAFLSVVLLSILILSDTQGKNPIVVGKMGGFKRGKSVKKKGCLTLLYIILFAVCLLTVMDVLHYGFMLIIVTIGLLVSDYRLFRAVNYALLGKFILLFVVVGNLAEIPWIGNHLQTLVLGNEFFVGIGLSQCLSNVPTAVILSKFADNGMELLTGVNVGGLGTLIASMASVISLEYYNKTQTAQKRKYITWFTAYNILFLLILCLLHMILA
ncbi:MAG: citrate transporter [Lachnospiraceae bacterium]|nr:citrate transporter [Lachnospiraceae bacterium]